MLVGRQTNTFTTVFACSHDYSTVLIMFYSFCFNKVPSKAFGIVWIIVDLILCKNRNFCVKCRNSYLLVEHGKILIFLQLMVIQIFYVDLFFQNFWSSRSMVILQIITACSVFDRFCFQCIVCLFSSFHDL